MSKRNDGQARGKYTLEFKLGRRQPDDVRATLDRGPAAKQDVRAMVA